MVLNVSKDEAKLMKCMRSFESRSGFPPYGPYAARDVWYCKLIMNDLSQNRAPLPHDLTLPEGLLVAWPHLVMFLVLTATKQYREGFYELVTFRKLAYGSREDLMKTLAPDSLHSREAVLPLGVTSLLVRNVLGDVTYGLPDIGAVYFETLDKLVRLRSLTL